MKRTETKQRREAARASQAIKSLRKLKFMLSLVDECYSDPEEMEFSELDAGKDTIGDKVDGVKMPAIQCLMETYLEIVGEFETVLPYVEAVLKNSKR